MSVAAIIAVTVYCIGSIGAFLVGAFFTILGGRNPRGREVLFVVLSVLFWPAVVFLFLFKTARFMIKGKNV